MMESVIVSTLAGSVICSALLLFKHKLLSVLGGKVFYYISLFAMLMFLLPMHIGDISIPKVPVNQEIHVTEIEAITPEPHTDTATVQNPGQKAPEEAPYNVLPQATNMVRRSNPITMQEILFTVWLSGFILSMCRYFISYFRFKKKICGFDILETINGVAVIKSPLVASPLVFGFFRPTLVVPEIEMDAEDYNLAIKHEMVHYKHHDSWFKLFAVIVNSICWFNPITYFMVNLIGEACEYACDEQVTKEMDMADKKQYSSMILSMVCQASPSLSSNMVKNKKQLKRRFEMIMKKKKFSVFKAAICMVLMSALTCGSVVLANEVAPLVSSLLKDDYVYITNYGQGNYNEFVPVEKDGVYYLPLREFLNKSDIENDKIRYDNGTITIDVWSNEVGFGGRIYFTDDGERVHENPEEMYPAKYIWSTECKIGSKTVKIANTEMQLNNAPYLENGITYVPYAYIELLKSFEDKMEKKKFNDYTHKFVSVMKYGFDSFESRFYCDDVSIDYLPIQKDINNIPKDTDTPLLISSNWYSDNADVSISKTGYRTKFNMNVDFYDNHFSDETGNLEIVLNKVTRIYSKGSDIEGLFTAKINGETVYDNEVGYITNLPIPAGEGIVDMSETKIYIGKMKFRVFFFGYGTRNDDYSIVSRKNREIGKMMNTKTVGVKIEEAKLNGHYITRANKENFFQYNNDESFATIGLRFDDYEDIIHNHYHINREEDQQIKVIDENTYSGHFYFNKNETRIDSFDAIITLLPDNKFELKSNDRRYIVRGTVQEFVPQWEWSDALKDAPVPKVVMIDG